MPKHKPAKSTSDTMITVMGKRTKPKTKRQSGSKAVPVFEEDRTTSPDGRISFDGVRYGNFANLRKEIAKIVESVDQTSSQEELLAAFKKIEHRIKGIGEWLHNTAPEVFEEQKQADDDDPPERIYWHYGYRSGAADALCLIQRVTGLPVLHEDYEL